MTTMNAVQSPRFEGTELHYFEGDTFTLELPITLQKQNGDQVNIGPADIITFTFYKGGVEVAEVSATNIKDNTVYLPWDADLTKKFKKGDYTYRLRYNGEFVRTILADCRICVE